MRRAGLLLAALAGFAFSAARADLLVDDFSIPQTTGTSVQGDMLFGQRSLTSFPGSPTVADGVFSYSEGGTALLRYGPPPGAAAQELDFRLVSSIDVWASSAGDWPTTLLILYSGGGTGRALTDLPDVFPPGGGAAVLPVLLDGMELRGDFDLARITGLAVQFGDLGPGAGAVTLDAIWVRGTVPAVPEAPPGAMLAAGLCALGGLLRRRAVRR